MNARFTPTAAYQVLHLLSCTRVVPPAGGNPLPGNIPHLWRVYPPARGPPVGEGAGVVPLPGTPGGYPIPGRGTPTGGILHPWMGYPPFGPGWGTPPPIRPGWGTPCLDLAGVPPTWPGWVPPLWTDRWTDTCQNTTFPRTTYAVGKNLKIMCKILFKPTFLSKAD